MNTPQSSPPTPILSPCISICQIDEHTGLCIGCGRTRIEIASWRTLDEDARDELMALLPERLEKLVMQSQQNQ